MNEATNIGRLISVCLLTLVILKSPISHSIAVAATVEEEARMTRCPEGQYGGPGNGAKRFSADEHMWFISAEFAKRFCMPESLVDPTLKGALAIAVRILPEQTSLCGMYMGNSKVCNKYEALWIDIYVDNRTAKIPKADETVKYYNGRSSEYSFEKFGWDESRRMAEYNGQYSRHDGKRRPFFPITSRKDVQGLLATQFKYLGVRNGWASPEGGGFIENYYEQDWRVGIDVIGLVSRDIGWGNFYNPETHKDPYPNDPVQRYVIATALEKDLRPTGFASTYLEIHRKAQLYPRAYTHIIDVPPRLAEFLHEARLRTGKANDQHLKDALSLGVAPVKP